MAAACTSKSVLATSGVLSIRETTAGQIVTAIAIGAEMAMAIFGVLSPAKD